MMLQKQINILVVDDEDSIRTVLKNVLQEYIDNDRLPNAYYVDIFDVRFESEHGNNGDCFHPSTVGHKFMADEQSYRSHWSTGDPYCS